MSTTVNRDSYLIFLKAAGYEHVAQHIASCWDTPDAAKIFRGFLLDQARGNRSGFPPDVYRAVMRLYTIYSFSHGCVDEWADTYFEHVTG